MAQARGAPGLSRWGRLGAVLAIPLLGAAALLLLVGVTHRGTAPTTTPVGVATPTPLPTPTDYPDLFSLFDQYVGLPPRSFGALHVPELATPYPQGTTVGITLAAPPANDLPAAMPVWRLVPEQLDPVKVASRFGIPRTADARTTDGVTVFRDGLVVDNTTASISWLAGLGVASPRLGGRPRDAATAQALATNWMTRSGLAPFSGAPPTVVQTSSGDSASLPEWTVTWTRQPPAPLPFPPIDKVVARVSGDGTLKQLDFTHPRVLGGSPYPLRPWQDALRDAQQGHWYRACCQPLPELTTPGAIHAAVRLSLAYATVRLGGVLFAIPMYAFDEGSGYGVGLVPAIAGG